MRKLVYALAPSLDGFIARADGSVDWLFPIEGEIMADFSATMKGFDTVLMGRKTYDFGIAHGMTAYPGMKNYVFSRTMTASPDSRVAIISADASAFVRDLKGRDGKDIWLNSGAGLARTFFDEKLIDEISLYVHPVLLGSGVPLFPELRGQIALELTGTKAYDNGLVLLSYRVHRG